MSELTAMSIAASCLLIFGLLVGFLCGWKFHHLWNMAKAVLWNKMPYPIREYGHYMIFVGFTILVIGFAIYVQFK